MNNENKNKYKKIFENEDIFNKNINIFISKFVDEIFSGKDEIEF